jgi:hypothetical protein
MEGFWDLVESQHGVVARSQLVALGFSTAAIRHRLDTESLHVLWRGVYAVGRPEVTPFGRWMAAVLACGPDAFLSHLSAAQLWEILPRSDGPIHVSVIAGYQRRRSGIVVHRRVALAASDVTACAGIPVTTAMCTLIDIAPRLERGNLERAINEADKLDLLDPEELRTRLDVEPSRSGVGVVRDVLDKHTFALTDSELERLFIPIAQAAGLPLPETQSWIAGFRVDFHWPALGLVVETDGLRYHRTAAQQARDRERDQALAAAGLTVLRFTHAQVRYEPGRVKAVLARVARRLATTTAELKSL